MGGGLVGRVVEVEGVGAVVERGMVRKREGPEVGGWQVIGKESADVH